MCVVSMVTDHYYEKWALFRPISPISPEQRKAEQQRLQDFLNPQPKISKEEIEEFRKLLERAREYDKRNNEPDCELQAKKQRVLDLVKDLGIEITFL
jgi:hypothetical protein